MNNFTTIKKMNSVDKLSVLFFIKRTKNLLNGESPIYCRLTMNGIRSEFAVNKSVTADIWLPTAGKARGNSIEIYRLNKSLENINEKINEILRQSELQGTAINPELIRNELLGINKQYKFIVEAYEEHNSKMAALIGKQFAPKTLVRHKTSLKHLKEFIKSFYKTSDIELIKINHQFLTNYEFWLKTNTKCQHNVVVKYVKNLGKILKIARNNGWMEHDPFLNTTFKYHEVDKPFLTKEELEKIMNKSFSIPRLEKIRDVFLFCCFTGLAFIDVHDLKYEDFITGANGERWIRKKRQKTKNWSNIPILPAAQRILDKYKNDIECQINKTILPVPSNQKMNAYLKEIADLCGLNIKLTTHVARHTFATTVTLSNHVSMEAVSKMLGHSSLDMTKKYARILDHYIADEFEKIKDKY
ncbi:MAG TPA: recombinase [Prolixibacteraceae bacterium]|nr:recombinase [Prolixibacteraceae bacterium]